MYIEKAFYLLKELRSFLAQLVFSSFRKYSQLGSTQLEKFPARLGSPNSSSNASLSKSYWTNLGKFLYVSVFCFCYMFL